MTIEAWNELKPGELLICNRGKKKGTMVVLTGDDSYMAAVDNVSSRGMCLIGKDTIWDEDAPWRRLFRNDNYRQWTKVEM